MVNMTFISLAKGTLINVRNNSLNLLCLNNWIYCFFYLLALARLQQPYSAWELVLGRSRATASVAYGPQVQCDFNQFPIPLF